MEDTSLGSVNKGAEGKHTPLTYGCVRVFYNSEINHAEAHVDQKTSGTDAKADFLKAGAALLLRMKANAFWTGRTGTITLHPTGPEIVKIVTDLLCLAFGTEQEKSRMLELRNARVTGLKSGELKRTAPNDDSRLAKELHSSQIDPVYLPEIEHNLSSIGNSGKVSIVPNLHYERTEDAQKKKLAFVYEPGVKNMFASDTTSTEMYQEYKTQVRDRTISSPGLTVTLSAADLGALCIALGKYYLNK